MEQVSATFETAKNTNHPFIVEIGGGKILDTAKAVAYLHVPVIVVPTSAYTDAPTSSKYSQNVHESSIQ